MNERIRELERRAFDAVWDLDNDPIGPGTHFRPDGFEKKFAELIVRECIAQCEKNAEHEWLGSGSKLSAFNIKEHFGVEE